MWRFTPDEFAWVWQTETERNPYPFPISILETPGTEAEYDRLRDKLSARYRRRSCSDLTAALLVLAHPRLRIISWGRFHRSDRRIRALAVTDGEHSAVLFQNSGATAEFGGDLQLVAAERCELGRQLISALPAQPAGGAGRMTGYTPGVRGDVPPEPCRPGPCRKPPVEERIRELLRAPRTAEGYLRIELPAPSGRPQPIEHLTWFDVRRGARVSGRYLVEAVADHTVVTPASTETIAAELIRRAGLDRR